MGGGIRRFAALRKGPFLSLCRQSADSKSSISNSNGSNKNSRIDNWMNSTGNCTRKMSFTGLMRRVIIMARHCECFRRIVIKSHASHPRPGWINRRGHPLCRRCWRSLVDSCRCRGPEFTSRGALKTKSPLLAHSYWPARSF